MTIVVICTGQNEDTHLQLIAQANKQTRLGVCGEGWGRMEWNGEKSFTPRGAHRLLWKKSYLLLIRNLHKVSTSNGKRSPLSSSGQREKGWLNLKQTSERLTVSWTAQWRNHPPRGCCWTDRRTEWGRRICYNNSIMCALFTTHHGSQYMQPTTTFDCIFRAVFVHSVEGASSPVSCIHYIQCTYVCVCVYVCLCELIDLAAETLSNATLQILPMHSPLKPERFSNSAWNWRSWIWSAPPNSGAQAAPNLIQLWNERLTRGAASRLNGSPRR